MKTRILILTGGFLLALIVGCGKQSARVASAPAADYLEEASSADMGEAGADAPAIMPASPSLPSALARAKKESESRVVDAEEAARESARRPELELERMRGGRRPAPAARELKKLESKSAVARLVRTRGTAPGRSEAPTGPNPEVLTRENAFSTFSMNVSDVSFKLAAASLEQQRLPDPTSVRAEEFFNAMNYHDPGPTSDAKLAFAWEMASHPFAHNRDLIRFSIQTGASGREKDRPLNLVVLLDRSGSMERADRALIVCRAMRSLAKKLTKEDRISVIAFARTPRLCVDGMRGGDPEALLRRIENLTPEGGTNLEAALDLGYDIAARHFRREGVNRVILLTDGAANLGDVEPTALKLKAEGKRKQGVALDCFGVGWDGYNDVLLEMLSRNADGRYGFLNNVEDAGDEFSEQLAGALRVAAANVKAQVEFNPNRVISYRQIGYEKRQLKKEEFRDNTVDAAEIGAAETGTGVYSVQINRNGMGPLGVVRVRFLNPVTGLYEERSWTLFHQPSAPMLAESAASMRLAGCSALFAEWLAGSPYAGGVSLTELHACLAGTPEIFANDPRPARLRRMVRQAQMIAGSAGGS